MDGGQGNTHLSPRFLTSPTTLITPERKWIPFQGQTDEETPSVTSLFDEKYFANCPPHLARVGELRAFISQLLTADPPKNWQRPSKKIRTFMFLLTPLRLPMTIMMR